MEIVVSSEDRAFISALGSWQDASENAAALTIDAPVRVPGMSGSWFEIAAALGVPGIPLGIAVNLLSSWIWSAFERSPNTTKARIIVRNDKTEVEIAVENIDAANFNKALEAALDHVNRSE